jgi:N-methylhydantoinase A
MTIDAPLSLGIDIGGTFTDIVVLDPSNGNVVIWKESRMIRPAAPCWG